MIVTMQQPLQIIPISAFKDNYIWLLHNEVRAIVVDPGDATPVLESLLKLKLNLHSILITHHHHDHIGGVAQLIEAFPNAVVYAPKLEKFNFEHISLSEGDVVEFSEFNLKLTVIDLPGHTLGHIAYYSQNTDHNLLFCGDTLFGAGCGRLFEGTAAQMFSSLQKLAVLPKNTKVYCTHEYTMHNINFALTLEPNNQALIERFNETLILRDLNLPSLPSSIALELATNPFLRCNSKEIQASIQHNQASSLEVFSVIREMRNHY